MPIGRPTITRRTGVSGARRQIASTRRPKRCSAVVNRLICRVGAVAPRRRAKVGAARIRPMANRSPRYRRVTGNTSVSSSMAGSSASHSASSRARIASGSRRAASRRSAYGSRSRRPRTSSLRMSAITALATKATTATMIPRIAHTTLMPGRPADELFFDQWAAGLAAGAAPRALAGHRPHLRR